MRIGASSVPALPVPALSVPVKYRREDIAERPARQPGTAVARTAESAVEREVTRIRSRAAAAQTETRSAPIGEEFSQHVRSALQSYTSNGPSIEERLGVELAGIDVYA